MTDTHSMSPRFGVFDIIGKSVRLFLANFVKLFLYAFAPLLVFNFFSNTVIGTPVFDPNAGPPNLLDVFSPAFYLVGVASVVFSTLVYALLIMLCYDLVVGEASTLSQYISHGLKNVLPLVILSIAFVIMFYLGLLFFILPGLYLLAVFVVLYQTVLIDGAGWKGLQASAALTKGFRWPVLGTVLLSILIAMVPFVALAIFVGVGGLAEMGNFPGAVVTSALNAAMYGFNAAVGTHVYLRLSELKRGGSSGDLTDIFR